VSSGRHLLIVAPPEEAQPLDRAAAAAGYRVSVCGAVEALARHVVEPVDLVIVGIPAPAARDLVAALREPAEPGGPAKVLPVLFIASQASEAEEIAADAVVVRPIDVAAALARVGALVAALPGEKAAEKPVLAGIDELLDQELDDLWGTVKPAPAATAGSRPLAELASGADLPSWRASTQVMPRAAAPTAAGGDAGGPVSPEEGGTFARHVRKTLSAIERRLFPDTPAGSLGTALTGPPLEDVLGDIDLDALGVDALPVPEFDVTFDDDEAQARATEADGAQAKAATAAPSTEPPTDPAAAPAPVETSAAPPVDPRVAADLPTSPARSLPRPPTAAEADAKAVAPPAEPSEGAAEQPGAPPIEAPAAPDGPLVGGERTDMLAAHPRPAAPAAGEPPALDRTEAVASPPSVQPEVSAAAAATVPGRPAGTRAQSPLPPQADLAELGLPELLHRVHREGFTGRVRFLRGDIDKAIYFEEGIPVYATSNLPHDRMGDLLFREGKITRPQYEQTRRLAEESGRRVGAVLVDLKLLKPDELFPTVRRHLEDILYSLFSWIDGHFELESGTEPPRDQKVRLLAHPDELVLEGIRRKLGPDRLAERLGGPGTRIELVAADLAAATCDAGLDDAERRVVALIDGQRTLAQLGRAAEQEDAVVHPLVYGLSALELVRLKRPQPEGQAHPSAFSSRLPPAVALEIDRERITAKHALMQEGDYFAVLGVRRDATDHEIRRAYEQARRDFAPERFEPSLAAELAAELRVINEVVQEAYDVLRDRTLRTAYRAHLSDTAGGSA
jgi:hypothetical protein